GQIEWTEQIGGGLHDYITSVTGTEDGGYIAGGYFNSSTITLSNGEKLENKGREDGLIIKYDSEGQIEWTEQIGGMSDDKITSAEETIDGGYIAGGEFYGTIMLSNGEELTSKGSSDGLIIKYNREGQIEWTEQIGGNGIDVITSVAETVDGGYIAGGYFGYTITLSNGEKLTSKGSSDGLIIKYNREGQIEWTEQIGEDGVDQIRSVAETADGGHIAGGYFEGSITLSNRENLTSKAGSDGLIIKYNREGQIEWTEQIVGNNYDYINSISETEDGGYIAGGCFKNSITLSNGETLTSKGDYDGLIVKIEKVEVPNIVVKQEEQIGGNGDDQITSTVKTADGGYIVGGCFSSNVMLSNGETLTSKGSYDGLIIKYNREGQIEWTEQIGGSGSDVINS
ncbi:MAG: hypothetical protein HFJ38_08335, partial [Bacilli bacterium]|nr:hypothetical protein [Bacilli bacterium]